MTREQIIKLMAGRLDSEVNKVRYEEDWEPERIAEELYDIVFESYAHCSSHESFDPSCAWCASAEQNARKATRPRN